MHIAAADDELRGSPSGDGPELLSDGSAPGIARVEGWGAVQTRRLRELLADSRVIVRPVLDPVTIPAVDQHDPPGLMRLALNLRDPVDVFPFGVRPSHGCDADHTVAFVDEAGPGQTCLPNLGPLSRFTHRAKTHGGWDLTQPAPGVFLWRSPFGYRYLVTRDGTIRLHAPDGRPPDDAGPPPGWVSAADPPPDDPAWDSLPPHTPVCPPLAA